MYTVLYTVLTYIVQMHYTLYNIIVIQAYSLCPVLKSDPAKLKKLLGESMMNRRAYLRRIKRKSPPAKRYNFIDNSDDKPYRQGISHFIFFH